MLSNCKGGLRVCSASSSCKGVETCCDSTSCKGEPPIVAVVARER